MKNSPREESIGAQMSIALQLMKKKNHHAIVNAGLKITMEQLAILEVLNFHGDMNMTELSHTVWKQNANVTRIVDKLERRQLLERKPLEGDRRAYLLCITEKGEQLFKKAFPIIAEVYDDTVSCITKEEEAFTISILKKMIKYLS